MKRGTIAKVMAMAMTVWFMALIRTDADPELWQIALITLGVYESAVMAIQIAQKEARKSKRNKIIRIRQQDAIRWAAEWFNPYKGVRA